MAGPKKSNSVEQAQDFGQATDYIQKADYDADLEAVQDRIATLEDRVGTTESFSETFKRAFDKNKNLDKTLSKAIKQLMTNDSDIKGVVSNLVRGVDRDWQKAILRKVGVAGWTLFVALAAFIAGKLI